MLQAAALRSWMRPLPRRQQQACWSMAWEEALKPLVEAEALKVVMTVRMCAWPRKKKAWQHARLLW